MIEQKRVLLVEDQLSLAQLMAAELDFEGFTVTLAGNGEEALQQIAQSQFDVMVTDLYMPQMGGIELIETLKATNSPLPIIVLSASRVDDIRDKLNDLEVFHYVDKPITDEKLTLLTHLIESL